MNVVNFRVKRVLIGASTILIAGVAYAKSSAIPAPNTATAPLPVPTGSTEALKQAVSELDQQVSKAQQQVAVEKAKERSVAETLKATEATEAVAAAQLQARIQVQTQYVAQTQQQPTVQTVTRASGTSGGDDGGSGDD